MSGEPLVVSALVAGALASRAPVVALETTVVTHGLPAEEGVRTALHLEDVVRENGAVPATIAVLEGRVRVGLSAEELHALAAPGRAAKLNLSNLAAEVAAGGSGSATVSATAWIATRAGIRVVATGGIGGVHRGEAGDVSPDLTALAGCPVAVVCAGAKAVLDLSRTRERLETLGVPVYGFGTDEFPAFYRRTSGLPVDARFDQVEALARAVRTHWELGSSSGVVIGNPIPVEHELPRETHDAALERALREAEARGVRGRELTPFLLERMRVLTEGGSVFSNLALLGHNAALGARLARALAGPADERHPRTPAPGSGVPRRAPEH